MKTISTLVAALAFGAFSSLAMAQQPPGPPPGSDHHPGKHGPHDCSKAPDAEKKAHCEARQAAMKKCKGMTKEDHRKCMMDAMPKKPQ